MTVTENDETIDGAERVRRRGDDAAVLRLSEAEAAMIGADPSASDDERVLLNMGPSHPSTHVEKDPLIFIGRVRVSADHCGFGFAQAENRGVVAATLHPLGAVKNLGVFGNRHRSLLAALNCTGIEPMA